MLPSTYVVNRKLCGGISTIRTFQEYYADLVLIVDRRYDSRYVAYRIGSPTPRASSKGHCNGSVRTMTCKAHLAVACVLCRTWVRVIEHHVAHKLSCVFVLPRRSVYVNTMHLVWAKLTSSLNSGSHQASGLARLPHRCMRTLI